MLTLFHNNQELPIDTTEYYVRELASGLDEIVFDISIWDPNYALMAEEDNIVDRGGQRYLIKQIDAGSVTAKIVAQLDLDEWRATMNVGYNSGTKTCAQQIESVKPTGWSVVDNAHVAYSRTITGDLTPLQICEECRDTYKVYIRWDNKDKVVYIYSQALGTPVGSFASRELNLKEINYKGKSQNFATRLYAYGKDGLSFADINSGKPYVDNNTYSSRVICAYWQDDRYTDKASLLADATENLAKLAVPERSYDCAIVDLQATNPDIYGNLDFSLFTTATLIDDIKNVAIDYMVVERHVWPYHPDRNDVIFNSSPVKIQNMVIQIENELTDPNSTFQQILQAEINLATDWLTDNNSHLYLTQNADGTIKDFLFINGDEPVATATQVMRINASGLGFSKNGINGPFTNAFVFDAQRGGHLIADFITAGTMIADRIRGGTLQSSDSELDPNFTLNLATGALVAKLFSMVTRYFILEDTGDITSRDNDTGEYNYITLKKGVIKVSKNGNYPYTTVDNTNGFSMYTAGGDPMIRLYGSGNFGALSIGGSNNGWSTLFSILIDAINQRIDFKTNFAPIIISSPTNISVIGGNDQYQGAVTIGARNSGTISLEADTLRLEKGGTYYTGQTGTFLDKDGNTITVTNGLITSGI